MRASRPLMLALLAAGLLLPALARAEPAKCLAASGKAGARCLAHYAGAIEKCRRKADAECEAALRAPGGRLERALAEGERPIRKRCEEPDALALGYLSVDDIVAKLAEWCADFAEEHLAFAFSDALDALDPSGRACQKVVAKQLAGVRAHGVREYGARCYLPSFEGKACKRARRDARLEKRRRKAASKIEKRCGAGFDALELVEPEAGDVGERIESLVSLASARSRHYALRVYPPNDLGPTSDFGPHPIGVRTLQLADPARPKVGAPAEPRPLTVEVYYPSTDAAVAGMPRDVVQVLGIPLIETPSFRDVAIAPGQFPVVLFSHGNGGIRFQSFFFTAHLASHGYVVMTPDHHGNTFVDFLAEAEDVDSAVNRPLDMSFLIDELEEFASEPGHFLQGAVDLERIGMSGHSFGGYTSFALAGPAFDLGTFTDPRIDAILPQAPGVLASFDDAFFADITIPTFVVGGSIDETTPFPSQQQAPYDAMTPGAAFVGLAELAGAGHFTFSDFCEVPRELLSFLGGFDEACEPRHLPWRHAHDIVNYLSLNFFDAILKDDAEALGRLAPAVLAEIESLRVETK